MDALCLECHSELLLSEGVNIEAALESILALLLLDFFGDVVIDGVKVIYASTSPNQSAQFWLYIQATSSNGTIEMPIALLEVKLEEAISCALLEHFHIVVINAINVSHQRADAQPTADE
jgi:hypothetical protein